MFNFQSLSRVIWSYNNNYEIRKLIKNIYLIFIVRVLSLPYTNHVGIRVRVPTFHVETDIYDKCKITNYTLRTFNNMYFILILSAQYLIVSTWFMPLYKFQTSCDKKVYNLDLFYRPCTIITFLNLFIGGILLLKRNKKHFKK